MVRDDQWLLTVLWWLLNGSVAILRRGGEE